MNRRILALLGLVCLAYLPVLRNGFLSLDDDVYVTENAHVLRGLSAAGVRWAFSAAHASNYHPLTWLSHMADVSLFGTEPWGHHLTSVLLHACNAALLYLALRRMTARDGASFFTAALFAVHPLRIESVAWVAERKDVLCGLFFMLTLFCYGAYARRPGALRYALVFLCLLLGLLAKPMLVSVPFVLLLLDFWPLERPRSAKLVWEKLPLFCLCLASGLVTLHAQTRGGAIVTAEAIPFGARLANALSASVLYLWQWLYPARLAIHYPHPALGGTSWAGTLVPAAVCGGAVLCGASYLAWRSRARRPYVLVGWLWYLVMLLPVIGLVQVGAQARADRYTYLPLVGMALCVAWGGREWLEHHPNRRGLVRGAAALVLAACVLSTWVELGHWRDSIALYEHTLSVTGRNSFVANNLAVQYAKRGERERARALLEQALPDPDAFTNLGTLALLDGDFRKAGQDFEAALRIQPEHAEALFNLGLLAEHQGDLASARERLERALRARPDAIDIRTYLAGFLERSGDRQAAAEQRAVLERLGAK